ncbi:MAG: HAD family hydrolase [Rikenellaceae bacterium]|jgi:phosphoglycolate phosphatase|nr:HAD family hydrolase [Rikenellaceae bacterium]
MKRLVIFDLDGTLVDTIADLAVSVNHALAQCGYPCHSVEEYKYLVGSGVDRLIERAMPPSERCAENVRLVKAAFLPHYDRHNTDRSRPYEGIVQLLGGLQARGVMMAVASNKYHAATEKIIGHFFPTTDFVAVFGQREGVPAKPDPAVVLEIMDLAGVSPAQTLYVGDSGVDMATAAAAGVDPVGVTWGFRPREELEASAAGTIVDRTEEILALL